MVIYPYGQRSAVETFERTAGVEEDESSAANDFPNYILIKTWEDVHSGHERRSEPTHADRTGPSDRRRVMRSNGMYLWNMLDVRTIHHEHRGRVRHGGFAGAGLLYPIRRSIRTNDYYISNRILTDKDVWYFNLFMKFDGDIGEIFKQSFFRVLCTQLLEDNMNSIGN